MKEQKTTGKIFLIAVSLIIFAALTRIIPHPFNFTAIAAMALFSGVVFWDKKWAYILPFVALFLTDLILGFHFSMIPVYACVAFTLFMGIQIKSKANLLVLGLTSLLSSIVFFLITNLPFWYADISLYPLTLEGTMTSYTMAIPFFKNQILGDLFYTAVIFGTYSLATRKTKVSIA
ncbi:MAG: hypothetical protein KA444_01245 [Bacteroidia bacterium]|nr:hypothetical protein [Bacteroidia bacterium]